MQSQTEWTTGPEAWAEFVTLHPELGYGQGRWAFHNFLRHFRHSLVNQDAIRRARQRLWVAHRRRFFKYAFECATGKAALLPFPTLAELDPDALGDEEVRQILDRRDQIAGAGPGQ